VEAGTLYVLSAWVRLPNSSSCFSTPSTGCVQATIRVSNSSGVVTAYRAVAFMHSARLVRGGWNPVAGSFTLSASDAAPGNRLYLYFEGPAAGISYALDDIDMYSCRNASWRAAAEARIDRVRACAYVHTCVRACVRACACVCVCVCVCMCITLFPSCPFLKDTRMHTAGCSSCLAAPPAQRAAYSAGRAGQPSAERGRKHHTDQAAVCLWHGDQHLRHKQRGIPQFCRSALRSCSARGRDEVDGKRVHPGHPHLQRRRPVCLVLRQQ
jgi:hypothetical protein